MDQAACKVEEACRGKACRAPRVACKVDQAACRARKAACRVNRAACKGKGKVPAPDSKEGKVGPAGSRVKVGLAGKGKGRARAQGQVSPAALLSRAKEAARLRVA